MMMMIIMIMMMMTMMMMMVVMELLQLSDFRLIGLHCTGIRTKMCDYVTNEKKIYFFLL
jgi:hypothetical protein